MYLHPDSETFCDWDDTNSSKCKFKFATQNECYDHVRKVHIKKDTLICRWGKCGKVCTIRSNLTNHLLKHIPIVNGVCYVCDRIFKWRGDSKKHLLRHNRRERKFNDAVSLLFTSK